MSYTIFTSKEDLPLNRDLILLFKNKEGGYNYYVGWCIASNGGKSRLIMTYHLFSDSLGELIAWKLVDWHEGIVSAFVSKNKVPKND
jgi:hypothetical protein